MGTANSAAICSDWVGVYTCALGTTLQSAASAAPDGTDGNTFSSVDKFRETCCATPPRTCSEWSAAWIIAQAANGGCRKDGAKMFFDTKKSGATVASPHGEAEVKAACCTANSAAICSDWVGVYTCASGTTLQSAASAAPDGTDGNTFSSVDKFREVCCAVPLKCSAWTPGTDVDRAAIHAPFTMVTVAGAIAVLMG